MPMDTGLFVDRLYLRFRFGRAALAVWLCLVSFYVTAQQKAGRPRYRLYHLYGNRAG